MNRINQEILKLDLIKLKHAIIERSTPKNTLILVSAVSTGYVLFKAFKFYLKKRKYRHIPGPPTKGLFGYFVGNTPEIEEAVRNGKILPDLLVKWHQTYGDVFKFQMMSKIIVVTSDKNAIKEAWIVNNYPKDRVQIERLGRPLGVRFVGNSLGSEIDNEKWKYLRSVFNPGFHRHVLMTFVDHFNQITNMLSEKLRSKADGKTVVSLMSELNRTTLDAIALIAFGMHTDAINKQDLPLNAYLSRILGISFKNFVNPLFKYKPSNFQTIREFRHMIEYIRKMGRDKILEKLEAYKNNEHMPNDILSSILKTYKNGTLDIETMTDVFVSFFVAGQETTANTLSFCFLEIAKNPEIVKKAREEIDRVLGERTEVTYQDVNELKYCSAIFKEALRLFPASPFIMRKVPENISIQRFNIPKDTILMISTYMNCRCEENFKNPLEFKPERFLKSESNENVENYVYFPFSIGPRNCIGQNFAQIEGVTVIAKLLQKFDFKLDPSQSFAIEQNLTLRPKDGTRCFITLRS